MLSSVHSPSDNRHKQALQPPVQSRRWTAGRRNTVEKKQMTERQHEWCWGNSSEKAEHTCDSPIKHAATVSEQHLPLKTAAEKDIKNQDDKLKSQNSLWHLLRCFPCCFQQTTLGIIIYFKTWSQKNEWRWLNLRPLLHQLQISWKNAEQMSQVN